jgi:putative flippase GtrA
VTRPAADELCVRPGTLPANGRTARHGAAPPRRANAANIGWLHAYARAHAVQLAHFVGVGAFLAGLNLLLLYLFSARLRLPVPLAVTAMYTLGTVPHFIYHRWITYRVHDLPVVRQGLRYVAMLVVNFLIMQTLVALAAQASLSPYVAVMASTGCTMVATFLVMTHVVFARRQGHR